MKVYKIVASLRPFGKNPHIRNYKIIANSRWSAEQIAKKLITKEVGKIRGIWLPIVDEVKEI